ncbi:MAG: DUF4491 family protein [Bacteroidales bacterium]|nr:DUF4491 family protein [Bacteroidales bacterium]
MSLTLFDTVLNLNGVIIGTAAFLSIALGRYLTIQAEYHFSKKFWKVFLILGILLVLGALITPHFAISAILSILGFTFLWGIGEIIEQEERVRKGWFPENPKKKKGAE